MYVFPDAMPLWLISGSDRSWGQYSCRPILASCATPAVDDRGSRIPQCPAQTFRRTALKSETLPTQASFLPASFTGIRPALCFEGSPHILMFPPPLSFTSISSNTPLTQVTLSRCPFPGRSEQTQLLLTQSGLCEVLGTHPAPMELAVLQKRLSDKKTCSDNKVTSMQ